jgi:hypothetical protein
MNSSGHRNTGLTTMANCYQLSLKFAVVLMFCAAIAWAEGAGRQRLGPSTDPQLVRDLRAVRKGDRVTLTWSLPRNSASRQSGAGSPMVARVCRDVLPAVSDTTLRCSQTVGKIDLHRSPGGANVRAALRFTDMLPDNDPDDFGPLRLAVYRIQLRDDRGHTAGFSNAASVPLAPVLPARGLHYELDSRGVYLIWEDEIESESPSLKFDYRIYRQEKGSSKRIAIPFLRALVHTPEGERWSGVDTGIEWEKTYLYSVTPVTRVYSQEGKLVGEIEGEDSKPLEITTHDIFAPAMPERLLAATSGPRQKKRSVDLLWAPNLEKDILGYNVYRREENGQPERINSVPITMLSFQDTTVEAAHKYFYCISAVDVRGNESARSQETTVAFH